MAGMYPDNQTLEVFGKTVTWPGVNSEGKFTNGDFNDPNAPPSYIPADTINLVVDNLNTLVTSMGGEPNNTEEEQLAALFSITVEAHKGIKRDAHGRAQVAAPVAPDDIARKADIDAVNQTSASHAAGLGSNVHGATVNAAANQIITRDASGRAKIAAPAAADDIARKAEVDAEASARNNFIARRDNPHAVTKAQVGLGNCNNTADSIKDVNYAGSAGNAHTISNIGIDALNPVVAISLGTNGYIKYRNGFLIQWGRVASSQGELNFHIAYNHLPMFNVFAEDHEANTFHSMARHLTRFSVSLTVGQAVTGASTWGGYTHNWITIGI